MRNVLEIFADVKGRDGAWMARCPAHEDRTHSLSIGTGRNGGWVVRCHANCETSDVLAAVGLTMADLMPDKPEKAPRGTVQTVYDYHAPDGTLAYQVVRMVPKDFRQRRPDGAGGWIWSLGDAKRYLYRLPRLQGQSDVWMTEGEKDADRLVAAGLHATTKAAGAGDWREEFTQQLVSAGCKVLNFPPDNDDSGRKYAASVVASCQRAGILARVVNLPGLAPKGDVSDYLDAHSIMDLMALATAPAPLGPTKPNGRHVHLTPASGIVVRPVQWLWEDRLPLGSLALLGGREGIGKSICAYTLAAQITKGTLEGQYEGRPRAVIIAATEDSWEHTIVPRLMAAEADLARIFRVDVTTIHGVEGSLSLPTDLEQLALVIAHSEAVLLILDPLLSRLDAALDTHKDAEVRQAMEPLVKLVDSTGACCLGLIHVNKSVNTDPLTLLMGSRAFVAVARSVLFVMTDPENEHNRLLGTPKNNLGRTDLPTRMFTIKGVKVADTPEGEVWTGKLEWGADSAQSIREAMTVSVEEGGDSSATSEAAEWLQDYLSVQSGPIESAIVKRAAAQLGHSAATLKRAAKRIHVSIQSLGFPRKTCWRWTKRDQTPARARTPTDIEPTGGEAPLSSRIQTVGSVGSVGSVSACPPARVSRLGCYCDELPEGGPCDWCDGPDRDPPSDVH